MKKDIWRLCQGENHIQAMNNRVWRIIEELEQTATRKLVDSFDEQLILEELIESSKALIIEADKKLHPVLYTPFRYPSLKNGSRFGCIYEPSLWYGSLNLSTAMAEKAFYRFNFLTASKAEYELIETPLTAFSVDIKTNRSIDLSKAPFSEWMPIISSPLSYEISQLLGTSMRQAGIEAVNYLLARDPDTGANVALFSANAFRYPVPDQRSFQSWKCIASKKMIEFSRSSSREREFNYFPIDIFYVNGKLPFPAN